MAKLNFLVNKQDTTFGIMVVLMMGIIGVLVIFNTTRKEQIKKTLISDINVKIVKVD